MEDALDLVREAFDKLPPEQHEESSGILDDLPASKRDWASIVNREEGLLQANISVFFASRYLRRFDLEDLLPENPVNCYIKSVATEEHMRRTKKDKGQRQQRQESERVM